MDLGRFHHSIILKFLISIVKKLLIDTYLRYICNFRYLEFEEFCQLSAKFLIEEDEEGMKRELKEAFRIYDKAGTCFSINHFVCYTILKVHGTVVLPT